MKQNWRVVTSPKKQTDKFVFGRGYGLTILFWDLLTFSLDLIPSPSLKVIKCSLRFKIFSTLTIISKNFRDNENWLSKTYQTTNHNCKKYLWSEMKMHKSWHNNSFLDIVSMHSQLWCSQEFLDDIIPLRSVWNGSPGSWLALAAVQSALFVTQSIGREAIQCSIPIPI